MKELNCKEIQSIGLEILRAFDEFANKHGLTYFLSGGTLLGAVRHKGFIPWDDDVDLMMPRPDYEYLIHHFHHERFHLSCCELESDYCSCHARLWDTNTVLKWDRSKAHEKQIGLFVDIFPIDGYPSSKLITRLFLYRVKVARSKISIAVKDGYGDNEKYVAVKKCVGAFTRNDGNYYARKLSRLAKSYEYDTCDYVGVIGANIPHLFKEKNPKKLYEKVIMLDFEDLKLPAPVGYHQYLKHLYGDYMQLPPEDKRMTDHQFRIYQIK